MQCFQKYIQYKSNNNVIKNHGSVVPYYWDISFEKLGGLPTVCFFFVFFFFKGRDKLVFQSVSPNESSEVLHTMGCKISLGTVC